MCAQVRASAAQSSSALSSAPPACPTQPACQVPPANCPTCCPRGPPALACADALRQATEDERRERFSFALARTLDMGPERLQQLLYSRSTGERLRAAEALVLEGRAYLAARSTLRDTF